MTKEEFTPIYDDDGNIRGILDGATADYLESELPQPDNALFAADLKRANRVRISDVMDQKFRYETIAPKELEELRQCFELTDDPACGHCMCIGDLTFDFFDAAESVVSVTLHHGYSIRCGLWKDDAELLDGTLILQWLADHGIPELLDAFKKDEIRAKEHAAELAHWKNAMPACIRSLGDKALNDSDVEPIRIALADAVPERADQIMTLYEWLGAGCGRYTGVPSYEMVTMFLLLEYSTPELVAVASANGISAKALEGARRIFDCWWFQQRKENELVPLEFHRSQ